MYAIVDIAGKQFKVQENQFIYTPKLSGDANAKVEFDNVLLVDDNGKLSIGAPAVKGAKITGKILEQVMDNKLFTFKKKRRKGFKKKTGHRTQLTKVLIEKITK